MNFRVLRGGDETLVSLAALREGPAGWTAFEWAADGGPPVPGRARREGDELVIEWAGARHRVFVSAFRGGSPRAGGTAEVAVGPETFHLQVLRGGARASRGAAGVSAGPQPVVTPMPGRVQAVHVETGQRVRRGDLLVTLEAMKMQNEFVAPADGRVSSVRVAPGAVAGAGDTLVVIEPGKGE